MTDPIKKDPPETSEARNHYQALVDRVEFQFGEPKNSGSSLNVFVGTVKRAASNFSKDYVFVRPQSKK